MSPDASLAMTSPQIASFRAAVRAAKHPMIIAGAGLSAASGIPTFRGAGGYWRSHDAMSLATPEAFHRSPSLVWQFYHMRREACLKAQPNAAHRLLASLMVGANAQTTYESVFPAALEGLFYVTQNVDGLSIRAGKELDSTFTEDRHDAPIQMHGALFRTICTRCGDTQPDFRSPICEALAGTEDSSKEYKEIPVEDLPRCKAARCGGLLRPGVVWFGESIPSLSEISSRLQRVDLILVLGTSSVVYPAAGFADQVRRNGGRVAVFNLERSGASAEGEGVDWFIEGPVEETLAEALGMEAM